jgi:hypothetical protein
MVGAGPCLLPGSKTGCIDILMKMLPIAGSQGVRLRTCVLDSIWFELRSNCAEVALNGMRFCSAFRVSEI